MHRRSRLLTGLLLSCAAGIAQGQAYATDRGVWQAGGTARFSHQSASGGSGDVTTIALAPELAYFVAPGLALGVSAPFLYSWISGGHAISYGAGPTATYYFGTGTRTVYPYLGAAVGVTRNRLYASGIAAAVTTENLWSWEARAGAVRMIARNAGITGEVYFRHLHDAVDSGGGLQVALDEVGLRFGLGLFLY
jgi:hypothetical protein